MHLCKWKELPKEYQISELREYYEILNRRKYSLILKRIFDIVISSLMLLILFPVFLFLAIVIKIDSKGPVFYRQIRITQYGKAFKIHKFRSMVTGADRGSQVTVGNDSRITRVGHLIRKCRLDEISQLIDILEGTMTFVGTRPEVPKYVERYTPEMLATLLLPAGVTSFASIMYKDEAELLEQSKDPDKTYIEEVLPEKMKYNLYGIKNFSFFGDIQIMFMTFLAVCGRKYNLKIN